MPVKLVKWLMKHVDPLLSEFRIGKKFFVINRDLVCKIMRLGRGNMRVQTSSDDVEAVKVVQDLREVYKKGERATIKKCIEVLKGSNDRESFIRAFTLLALGTILCPGTGNYMEMKYLYSLLDTSQVSSYDWAGLVIEELMSEIKKYQKFSPERLEHDHQIGSCLIILAIAYMDHFELPSDRGHQINYNLPRICNISNRDFEYIMTVDWNKLSLNNSFGKRPFRPFARTPYADVAPPELIAPAAHPPSQCPRHSCRSRGGSTHRQLS
ncbi:unnamed protein product [Urochloa humidicola]